MLLCFALKLYSILLHDSLLIFVHGDQDILLLNLSYSKLNTYVVHLVLAQVLYFPSFADVRGLVDPKNVRQTTYMHWATTSYTHKVLIRITLLCCKEHWGRKWRCSKTGLLLLLTEKSLSFSLPGNLWWLVCCRTMWVALIVLSISFHWFILK